MSDEKKYEYGVRYQWNDSDDPLNPLWGTKVHGGGVTLDWAEKTLKVFEDKVKMKPLEYRNPVIIRRELIPWKEVEKVETVEYGVRYLERMRGSREWLVRISGPFETLEGATEEYCAIVVQAHDDRLFQYENIKIIKRSVGEWDGVG